MTYLPSLPDDAILPHVYMAFPDASRPLNEYTQVVMRGDSPFTPAERELIAAYVSELNACGFCAGSHRAVAKAFGVKDGVVDQLLGDPDTAAVDDAMRPVLRYVRKLTLTPSQVTSTDTQAILDAGWPERALFDAASVCALFNLFNRVVDGLGIAGSPQIFADAGQRLSDPKGYANMPVVNGS